MRMTIATTLSRFRLIAIAAIVVATIPVAASATDREPSCAKRLEILKDEMRSLSRDKFDQDMSGGWRPLSKAGCYEEAAEAIAAYQVLALDNSAGLNFHRGQMLAMADRRAEAIEAMEQTRLPARADTGGLSWNDYLDGTLAF